MTNAAFGEPEKFRDPYPQNQIYNQPLSSSLLEVKRLTHLVSRGVPLSRAQLELLGKLADSGQSLIGERAARLLARVASTTMVSETTMLPSRNPRIPTYL